MRTLRSALGPLPRTPVQSRFTEAIVVLGAGLGPRGKPTPGLVSRLETTLRLAQRSPRAAVVLSGGGAGILPEADVMARWLVERGVLPQRIVVEDRSQNTRENARFTIPVLADLDVRAVTLVTEAFHMRRARMLFSMVMRQQGLGDVRLTAVAAPTRNTQAARRESPVPLRDLRAQAREWLRAPRPNLDGAVELLTAQAQGVIAAFSRKKRF